MCEYIFYITLKNIEENMKLIGNILWFLLCGVWLGIAWFICGLLWCITVIGIPVGVQCFKMTLVSFFPFGKDIILSQRTSSVILNILWFCFGGLELSVANCIAGILWCITIIGIPFGMQCFKLMKLSLLPFGAEIK